MLLATKGQGYEFNLPPEGVFQGVVFAVYDGGMQKESFQGEEKLQHKIKIGIELSETYTEGKFAGERITRYVEFTLSLHEKGRLLPVIESLLGRALTNDELEIGFDVESLIGKNCQVSILHKNSKNGKQYADTKISAIMKNTQLMTPVLNREYRPEFIAKWIAEGMPINGESINNNNSFGINEMENNLLAYVKDNLFSMGDLRSSIYKEHGKPCEFKALPIEEARVVYDSLCQLAKWNKTEGK